MLVSLSSKRGGSDVECRFVPGGHPFISRASFLRCDDVHVADAAAVEEGLRSGLLSQSRDAAPEMLTRAREAVLASRLVPIEAKRLLRLPAP